VSEIETRDERLREPPRDIFGIIGHLGPGLIIAGSIVGSGELIATTAVGAESGFWLLWLIVGGCVIKVFTQVELGRYTISSGKTTMEAMDEVPGPRFRGRGNWLVWYWFVMFGAGLAQLGGIVGGVGQALSISVPLTSEGREQNAFADAEQEYRLALRAARYLVDREATRGAADPGPSTNPASLARAELATAIGALATDERAQVQGSILGDRATERVALIELARAKCISAQTAAPDDDDGVLREIEAFLDNARPSLHTLARFATAPDSKSVHDDTIWAAIVTAITCVLLVVGRYGLIQTVSTLLVAIFTVVTGVTVVLLQTSETWHITGPEFLSGCQFRLPPPEAVSEGKRPLMTALAAFGIIGVGAAELVAYPYWCLEKGYARFAGPRNASPAWGARARGWLKVLEWDAWCSMVIYTFATLAFFLLGAATLGRVDLHAEGTELVRTLAVMYEPVFGKWATVLFLFGAFAVLYSTFFVATAGHARTCSDGMRVIGIIDGDEKTRKRWIKILSGVFPLISLIVYVNIKAPKQLILASGILQALMLPMLAGAALWFRYARDEATLRPGRLWDAMLWISAIAMLVAGLTLVSEQFGK
jgi:Mn2+/Fe2+ NRAMP family transporter